jgi:hypothetical protein
MMKIPNMHWRNVSRDGRTTDMQTLSPLNTRISALVLALGLVACAPSTDGPSAEDGLETSESDLRATGAQNRSADAFLAQANQTDLGFATPECKSSGTQTRIAIQTLVLQSGKAEAALRIHVTKAGQQLDLVVPNARYENIVSREGNEFSVSFALAGKSYRLEATAVAATLTTQDGAVPMQCAF